MEIRTCDNGCTNCPVGVCVLNCLWDEYYSVQAFACNPCIETCEQGCVNGDNCSLCQDEECADCESFVSECITCIVDTVQTDGDCECIEGKYYNPVTHTCDICNEACTSCSCGRIDCCPTCSDGFFSIDGADICLDECPTGKTAQNGICVDEVDQVLCHEFNSQTVDAVDLGPYALEIWSIDVSAPYAIYRRGIYFDGVFWITLEKIV